ncbi:hypothetical protein J2046_004657 [Rhizobium petrolearium]|uniref:DUF2735 domain-containing protein n=1 Tax=Neorhizobium petrolearium TaxID=515361 RepID=UPI001AE45E0E|nr:DUF2735 domain-containing protein [Neorhizobium petrolearium]MBP1846382.1 hypothetical protein [Neorhizobium petrolearium]
MKTNIHRETAKIYQFPIRPRQRPGNGRTAPGDEIHEVAANVLDTCWYHDEAVRDDETRSNDRPKPC